jgi:hypothetical protein
VVCALALPLFVRAVKRTGVTFAGLAPSAGRIVIAACLAGLGVIAVRGAVDGVLLELVAGGGVGCAIYGAVALSPRTILRWLQERRAKPSANEVREGAATNP